MHQKSEAINIVSHFIRMAERKLSTKLQFFQTDKGGGYRKLDPLLESLRIEFQHPCPYTHQQQGRAERRHRIIVDLGLTLLA